MKGQFEKYVNLIRNISWKIAKKYNLEYSDVEAQGFLIYCMLLENYDVSKAKFSTYLYIQLWGRLDDYACKLLDIKKNESGNVFELEDDEMKLDQFLLSCESVDYELDKAILELLTKAKKSLDEFSYNVFQYIISFEWLKENRRKPTVSDVMRKFNIKRDYANIVWNNCKNFWLNVA